MIRALFFDLFGTVYNWRDSLEIAVDNYAQSRGVPIPATEFVARWHQLYVSKTAHAAHMQTWQPLEQLLQEQAYELLCSYTISQAQEIAKNFVNMWQQLVLWPDSQQALQQLRTATPCIAMSNASFAMTIALARQSNLQWDMIAGANLAQRFKPDPQTYLAAAAALQCEPQECCMVAAHNMDLQAAAALGFQTAFLKRPQYKRSAGGDELPQAVYTFIADDLLDLAQQYNNASPITKHT